MILPNQFHQHLKSLRLEAGLTLRMVAESGGPNRMTLSRAERGLRVTDLDLGQLAQTYRCTPDELTKNTDYGFDEATLLERGQQLLSSLRIPTVQPGHGDWPFSRRLKQARRLARKLVASLEAKIDAQPHALDLAVYFRDLWTDSAPEAVWWLHLGAIGFIPIKLSLASLGFRQYPVLCARTGQVIGDVPLSALYLPTPLGPVVLFPQVTLLAPRCRPRVDALVFLGPNHWAIGEVDGDGHNSSDDWLREQGLDIPICRLTWPELQRWRAGSETIAKIQALYPRLGLKSA